MNPPERDTCQSCFYAIPLASGKSCFCCRNAPVAAIGSLDMDSYARFPVVHINWWCGEYKAHSTK